MSLTRVKNVSSDSPNTVPRDCTRREEEWIAQVGVKDGVTEFALYLNTWKPTLAL